jgi:hypothetical protein
MNNESLKPEDCNRRLIDSIGFTEPLVHAVLMLHRRGDIDYEQALIFMVKELVDAKNVYLNKAIYLQSRSTKQLTLSQT